MKISNPEVEVKLFSSEDVIATSAPGPLTGMTGLFYIPASQVSGGPYSGNYVQVSGQFGNDIGGAYKITNITSIEDNVDADKANLDSIQNGNVYLPDVGITIPASLFENIAHQTYDAFSFADGQYATFGVSYYELHWQ